MRAAGVKVANGSDVLGPMFSHQSDEVMVPAEVSPAIEAIGTAVADGGCADLRVFPLKGSSARGRQGHHMSIIMKDSKFVKNQLDTRVECCREHARSALLGGNECVQYR
jgi:hypothetical protein